jgi:hypothetical protein
LWLPQRDTIIDEFPKRQRRGQIRRTTRSFVARGLLQLAVDPQLDAADRKQVELGFSLAGYHPVADPKLPFLGARRDRRQGVFDALVDHATSPARLRVFNPKSKPKVVTYN